MNGQIPPRFSPQFSPRWSDPSESDLALATATTQIPPDVTTADGFFAGKWIFAGVFALLIVWLLLIPARRIGQAEGTPPWWRNVRVWAILVAATQMMVYIIWG